MKAYRLLFLLTILVLFESCGTWKSTLVSSGDINDAINNIITDFLHTSKLNKKDTIFTFYISEYEDVVYNPENNEVVYIPKKEETFIISIGRADNKIYPREENKVGTYDEIFPTRYTIRDGKLFYWSDTTQVITQEIISVLDKYNHIDFDWHKEYDVPPFVINDGAEGLVYYFCKNDLKNYKKKKSDNIRRHYRTPKLNCK
ncbi:MAG: hypothetical protein LBS69_11055 [Prevotellaceae bacterium]|jgi:hypothetical protein|nr:hypothetical protein [Prevotellaceae bacterium]